VLFKTDIVVTLEMEMTGLSNGDWKEELGKPESQGIDVVGV